MSTFLKRAIRDGISKGIGDAVDKAVREVVEPKATRLTSRAAQYFDQAAGKAAQEARKTASGLEGAFANLEQATPTGPASASASENPTAGSTMRNQNRKSRLD